MLTLWGRERNWCGNIMVQNIEIFKQGEKETMPSNGKIQTPLQGSNEKHIVKIL